MPGVRSQLDRHEWIKHGTCSGVGSERYFSVALKLTEAINASALPRLFAENLGNTLSAAAVARAVDAAFGAGAGRRVGLECVTDGSRRLISGLRFALDGALGDKTDLATLLSAAEPRTGGCRGGVVDPAGLQ